MLIPPVTDSKEKQRTYREQLKRYNMAMKYDFCLQAIMIDYAMLEDRLRAMLYHLGFLFHRTDSKIWKRMRPYLKAMVEGHKEENENRQLGVKNISGKIKLLRCVLLWTQDEDAAHGNKDLTVLEQQCECMDIGATLEVLQSIPEWCRYRNEVVHGLMNKNSDSLDTTLQKYAEEGMALARDLDREIKSLKRRNKIRRYMKLPTD